MSQKTRKAFALIPGCQALDVRLAPSGNFMAQGFTEVADAVKHIEHRPAEHGTMGGEMHTHDHHHTHAK